MDKSISLSKRVHWRTCLKGAMIIGVHGAGIQFLDLINELGMARHARSLLILDNFHSSMYFSYLAFSLRFICLSSSLQFKFYKIYEKFVACTNIFSL